MGDEVEEHTADQVDEVGGIAIAVICGHEARCGGGGASALGGGGGSGGCRGGGCGGGRGLVD